MPYIQNTDADLQVMLEASGLRTTEDLFASIPPAIRCRKELDLPDALSEQEVAAHLREVAARNQPLTSRSFLGAGAYRHFVPAIVDHLSSRGEFLTAYTPYQPELAQGTLQCVFEFQSLITHLTGLEIANASLYDGGSACAEAVLLALKSKRGEAERVIFTRGVHPHLKQVTRTYLANSTARVEEAPLAPDGRTDLAALRARAGAAAGGGVAAIVFQTPNFLGYLEEGEEIVKIAHEAGALALASCYPVALGLLEPPGAYGADVVFGEASCFGNGPSFGGPGVGYFAARDEYRRAMPGRIVGLTRDRKGRPGYVLALQTREQHIRREKATSNICTNQQLIALRATIHMTALGRGGLARLAELNAQKAHYAARRIAAIPGFALHGGAPFFNEFTVVTPRPAAEVNAALFKRAGIIGGLDLSRRAADLPNRLLVCVTEQNTKEDIDLFLRTLKKAG
ncbi:MAG: aminomethyl-transferring glycine dehydrogenase subunit GcvPA [Planctomycetes bacterium]|nr:aminomethyl-transferring glycine dehydrogenase subunit GcvPA [Planctomycetota bacterium]